jgi:hypothetical protein
MPLKLIDAEQFRSQRLFVSVLMRPPIFAARLPPRGKSL